jgi:hypothetical protein
VFPITYNSPVKTSGLESFLCLEIFLLVIMKTFIIIGVFRISLSSWFKIGSFVFLGICFFWLSMSLASIVVFHDPDFCGIHYNISFFIFEHPLYLYITFFFIHSSTNEHFNWSVLVIEKIYINNMRVDILWYIDFISFWYIASSGTGESVGSSAFSFLRKFSLIFHKICQYFGGLIQRIIACTSI